MVFFGYLPCLLGVVVALLLVAHGRAPTWEDAIVSNLLSPVDNPRGCLFAATPSFFLSFYLLQLTRIFLTGVPQSLRFWPWCGVWLFRLGLVALAVFLVTSVGVIGSPEAHANLAYVIYACFLSGLLLMIGCLTRSLVRWRLLARFTVIVELATLLVLVQLFRDPTCLEDRTILSLCEWGLNLIVATGSVVLAVCVSPIDARAV